MPTFRHGKNTQFKLGSSGTPTTLTDISTSVDSVTFPRTADLAETTTFLAGARTYIPGFPGTTFSISGKFDATTDSQLSGVVNFDTPLAIQFRPEGAGAGRVQYDAPGGAGASGVLCTAYNVSAPVGDVVTFTAEFTTTGTVTRSTP